MAIKPLSQQLKTGELCLHSYLDNTLRLIDATEPAIHALLPEPQRQQRLHQAAEQLLAQYPDPAARPPLFGVLIGVKDLFNVDGLATRAGSKLPAEAFAGAEAQIVTQLKQLGAIVLGKTVSTEFAYFSPGETRNPRNPNHTPGGSSSGSAAAVAAGYCPLALGTQTIASIIRPASYCGVYGYKPSWGLVSTEGVFPFSQSADHVGFIAGSMTDLIFVAEALGIYTAPQAEAPRQNLGCVEGTYLMQADKQALAEYHKSLDKLSNSGDNLLTIDPFGDIEQINASHRKLIAAEFARNHAHLYAKYSSLYSQHSAELYSTGEQVTDIELQSLRQEALSLRASITALMQKYNIGVWLSPSTTQAAPLGLASTGSPLMSLPWTNAGLPSLTIPCAIRDANKLAYGLQVIGGYFDDSELLNTSKILADIL